MIWGDHEDFVPAPLVRSYVAAARLAGDRAEVIIVPNAGHFEPASPLSTAWPTVLRSVQRLLRASAAARR
jgi:pimeloyl-ACP methyl ester carboxylesterase